MNRTARLMPMPLALVRSAVVTAPSRLHFGMFSFGQPAVRQFGGVGAMVDSPQLRLSIGPAEKFAVVGLHRERTRRFAETVLANLRNERTIDFDVPLNALLEVHQAPREHVGLGLGTQLGLSVAAAVCAALGLTRPSAIKLAGLAGRGARSAVGTHGFDQGGLLVEAGKLNSDTVSPLIARIDIPAEWRFLLIIPRTTSGLAGGDEQQAFERLPPVPPETTDRLLRETMLHMLPAAAAGDFVEFGASLYRFGHLAGSCFAAEQGGPFADERTAQIVAELRRIGVTGAGQSSWGPTIFALVESQTAAENLRQCLRTWTDAADYECLIARPSNKGAVVEIPGDD
jgi:beta-ribofuranosylaminobenzene 5'-phosphate synthase